MSSSFANSSALLYEIRRNCDCKKLIFRQCFIRFRFLKKCVFYKYKTRTHYDCLVLNYLNIKLTEFSFDSDADYRWHCTKSHDCKVRVGGAPSNVYGVNVTKAVIGEYM